MPVVLFLTFYSTRSPTPDYARRNRAVVLSTPTAIKSLALKFVELCHIMASKSDKGNSSAVVAAQDPLKDFLGTFGFWKSNFWSKKKKADAKDPSAGNRLEDLSLAALRRKCELCSRTFAMFRTQGVLLLDEVDLILHPLKSELNWPIGPKEALDLTDGQEGLGPGIRWLLPHQLLEAFRCVMRRVRAKPVKTVDSGASALDMAVPLVTEAIKLDSRKQYAEVRVWVKIIWTRLFAYLFYEGSNLFS